MAGTTDGEALLLTVSADTSKALKAINDLNRRLSGIAPEMERNAKKAAASLETSFSGISADKFKSMLEETAALQDKLQAARKAANLTEATSINQQIVLQERLQRAAVAQLETQLAIAKATGNNKQAAELQETLAVFQQFQKLSGVGIIGTKGLAEAKSFGLALKEAETAADAVNFGKAGKSLFDSAKFATLEEGGAKLRIFGSALEPLGPIGIAAAGGVLAVAEAFAKSHEAIEYADGIYKAAAAAHTSTEALQEYRVAIVKAGGDASSAGPALLQFSEVLGKAAEGLKGLRPFQALFGKGFSVANLKGLGGTDQALDAVVAKIQNLSSRSQQDAAISQFGLQGLAPLILAGADAWNTYREEAKAAGLVLDRDVINRGHELNVQMDELTGKIKNELTTAFIDLGPVLVGLLGLVDKMLDGIGKFSGEIARNPIFQNLIATSFGLSAGDAVRKFGESQVAEFGVSGNLTEAQLQAGLGKPKGKGKLADLTKTHNGSDQTAALDKSALDALNTGKEALARAQAGLIVNIEAHAQAEKDAVDVGLKKKLDDLELEAQKIAHAKNDADKLAQRAKINSAKVAEQEAAEAQKRLIEIRAETALRAHNLEIQRADTEAVLAGLRYQQASAVTAVERNALSDRILARQQDLERRELNLRLDPATYQGSASDAAQERRDLADRQRAAVNQQALDQENPIQKYARSIQDLTTEVQGDAVTAFQNLTSGLVDAALHAKNLGDVAKNVFLELIQQILTQTLQKEALPGLEAAGSGLLHVLGLASGGTVSGPGSSTSDSIPAMLSDGEFVVKASAASKHRGLLEAINNGRVPRLAAGGFVSAPRFPLLDSLGAMRAPSAAGVTVIQPFHFHAEGAVMSEELLAQANRAAAGFAAQSGRAARAGAVADVQRAGYAGNLNQ